MLKYILKRLAQTLLVLFVVSIFAFLLIRIAPGSPAEMMVPDGSPPEAIKAMEVKLGLDKPLYVQYWKYISGIFKGDLGISTAYRTDVGSIILKRLPVTARLALISTIVGCLVAVPLSILAGSKKGSFTDFFTMSFALLGQAMSPVWLSVLDIFVFAVWLGWFPTMGVTSAAGYVLPVSVLAYQTAAQVARIGRSGMIDTLSEDYITATYAKGIRRSVVNWKYAFRNAMVPVTTLLGVRLGYTLTGAIIVETIFSLPGVGRLLNVSVANRDYALVQSLILLSACCFAVINLIVDIINSFIDPRIANK